jgi:D-galactosamine 6-phosphate deaminase/isomerase
VTNLELEPNVQTDSAIRSDLNPELSEWFAELASSQTVLGNLLRQSDTNGSNLGFRHTVTEICQQPVTWRDTLRRILAAKDSISLHVRGEDGQGLGAVSLTGSGSSLYVGECLKPDLQRSLEIAVAAVGGGDLLTHGRHALAPGSPSLLVSFGRSGNSPESTAGVDLILETYPECRHLAITCNPAGRLATSYATDARLVPLVLHPATHDNSLVMTSSFTNMVLAGGLLGVPGDCQGYVAEIDTLCSAARGILLNYTDRIADVARSGFSVGVYLGSGGRFGAARESALKMMEMTAGRIRTFPETFLGLRHGPMAAVRDDALLVLYLSSDPLVRAYELDLIREINQKKLGAKKVIVGERIPADLVESGDLAIECPGAGTLGETCGSVLGVVVGQLLGLFRCLEEGLNPDAPSEDDVITRVVGEFQTYGTGNDLK